MNRPAGGRRNLLFHYPVGSHAGTSGLTFAYPNGIPGVNFGVREKCILKGTSVKLAFSTQPCNFRTSDDVFAIPRYGLSTGSMNFVRLKLFLGKYYSPLRKLIRG